MLLEDITKIILSDEPGWISEVKKYTKVLNVHINGKNVAEHLNQIEIYENPTQFELRKKFATSNKNTFSNLLRPVDKVFHANGGSRIVKTKTETSEKKLKEKIKNLTKGYSVRKFVSNLQSNKYYSDPSGLVFFEWENGEAYPTFKSILSIRNYETDGRKVQWVLFEPKKRLKPDGSEYPGEFYRFVDEAKDYIFHVVDKKIRIIEDEVYSNPWGYVPAFVNSDILNSDLDYHISPVDSIIELAEHYLRTTSVKNIYEFLHGYPIFWAYVQKCRVCDGTGLYNTEPCSACGGDGHTFKKDVSDVIKLMPPESDADPQIAPNVAGYVQPDLSTWEQQRTELDWLWQLMQFTMWGTTSEQADNETATAAFLDVQPVNDRLNLFADAFENTEKLIIDIVGDFYANSNYEGVSVNYGRRFLMESPDKIWDKYQKARKDGAPQITLNYLLKQYYQSEFQTDIESLIRAEKGIMIEPFIHYPASVIIGWNLPQLDIIKKQYFDDWWKNVDDNEIIMTDIETLKQKFENYAKQKAQGVPGEELQETEQTVGS